MIFQIKIALLKILGFNNPSSNCNKMANVQKWATTWQELDNNGPKSDKIWPKLEKNYQNCGKHWVKNQDIIKVPTKN